METFGIWSVVPPLAAIILAVKTKQVFVSLLFGIYLSWVIVADGNIFAAVLSTVESLVNVFSDGGNTRIVIFSLLVGVLIGLIQKSGGVAGFNSKLNTLLKRQENTSSTKSRKLVEGLAMLTGIVLFIETNISVLTTGTVFRPAFDNLKIPREKLAYIVDSTCAPVCVLIPFNAWGAYIIGLLAAQNLDSGFDLLLLTIPLNFYAILALAFVGFIIYSRRDFGPMKRAEARAREAGEVIRKGSSPAISEELISEELSPSIEPQMNNMIIPVLTTVVSMPIMLIYTGARNLAGEFSIFSEGQLISALKNSSGSEAVLISVILGILSAIVIYSFRKLFSFQQFNECFIDGIRGMLPLALLMVFAFAIGDATKVLGTGEYLAGIARSSIAPEFIPLILFLLSAAISFSTGTSWGTFAIMLAIGIPASQHLGVGLPLSIAAVLSGGVFGDHCSPISDTTIVSSMASASDHIDHVNTQLPYALTTGCIAAVLFMLAGMFF